MYQLDIIDIVQIFFHLILGLFMYFDLFHSFYLSLKFIFSNFHFVNLFFHHPLTSNCQLNCKFMLDNVTHHENQNYFESHEIKVEID